MFPHQFFWGQNSIPSNPSNNALKRNTENQRASLLESLWKSRVFQLCSSVELCSKNIATWIVLVSLVECARMKAEKNVEAHEFHNLILQVKVSATKQRWDIYFTYIRSIGMQQRASWTLGVCTSMSASHPGMEKPRWIEGNYLFKRTKSARYSTIQMNLHWAVEALILKFTLPPGPELQKMVQEARRTRWKTSVDWLSYNMFFLDDKAG